MKKITLRIFTVLAWFLLVSETLAGPNTNALGLFLKSYSEDNGFVIEEQRRDFLPETTEFALKLKKAEVAIRVNSEHFKSEILAEEKFEKILNSIPARRPVTIKTGWKETGDARSRLILIGKRVITISIAANQNNDWEGSNGEGLEKFIIDIVDVLVKGK